MNEKRPYSTPEIPGQTAEWYRNWAVSLEGFAADKESKARRLIDEAMGQRAEAEVCRAYADILCHHCNKPPEADGDHTCPCPFHDNDCPDHPAPRGSSS